LAYQRGFAIGVLTILFVWSQPRGAGWAWISAACWHSYPPRWNWIDLPALAW